MILTVMLTAKARARSRFVMPTSPGERGSTSLAARMVIMLIDCAGMRLMTMSLKAGTLTILDDDLSVQGISVFTGDAFFNDTTTITANGELVIVPKAAPGTATDGEVWITTNPTSAFFFRDDSSVIQKVWATPNGLVPRRATTAGPTTIATGGGTIVVSENIALLAGSSALVMIRADIRLTDGAGAVNELQMTVEIDGTPVYLELLFVPSFAGNTSDQPVLSWSWFDYVDGPFTTLRMRCVSSFPGNLVRVSNSKIAVLGIVPTSIIL